jgi:hypothetical protein
VLRSLAHEHGSVSEAERVLAVPDIGTPFGLRGRAILERFDSTPSAGGRT